MDIAEFDVPMPIFWQRHRHGFVAMELESYHRAVVIYGIVGLVFLSSPKWVKLTLEFKGLKAELAQLKHQNDNYKSQIGELQTAKWLAATNAAHFVQSLKETRQDIEWATFLPTGPYTVQGRNRRR